MMDRAKFIIFLLILNFVLIEGDKDKNLRKLDDTADDIEEEDESTDDNEQPTQEYQNPISPVVDNTFPYTYIFGFSNYKFYENPYIIQYDVIIRIANYSNIEVNNITMKVDIKSSRLRFLEVEEVTCIKYRNMSFDIYRFICSKEINGYISQISYVDNSIILNEKIPLNSSYSEIAKFFGKNIQNQTDNIFSDREDEPVLFRNCFVIGENAKLLFEGETSTPNINSKEPYLTYVQDEDFKSVVCVINYEGNNRFKMTCDPKESINADLANNNAIHMEDLGIIVQMIFEEGRSFAKLEVEEIPEAQIKINPSNPSSDKNSKSIIIAIIILFIVLLIIIVAIVILCKCRSDLISKDKNNDTQSENASNKANQTNQGDQLSTTKNPIEKCNPNLTVPNI